MGDWEKKRGIMHQYDRSAAAYDGQYAGDQRAEMEAALRHLSHGEDSVVLDLGCGTGLLFEHLGGSVGLLVGLDISRGILREAKKRVKRFPRVHLVRGDADFTPFAHGVFDGVFAVTLLQNMPKPASTLHEMKRVGKRDSVAVVTGLKKEFSLGAFVRLLKEAGLKASILEAGGQLKGYVAVCRRVDEPSPGGPNR